ncbi:MAG: hypothetical protein ABDH59_08955 [Fervidobacterium sp.]
MHEDVALGVLVLAECAHFYSAFNPSIFTIRRFPDEQTKRDITIGCLLASIFGIAISFATAKIAKSNKPLIFGIIAVVSMDIIYLYAAYTANGNNPINKQTKE